MSPDARILIGTSGYSFEDWKGRFYPDGIRSSDMLSYYASQFPMVEINYTYYRMPSARVTDAMGKKTPADFEFVVKLNRVMTHENPIIGSFIPPKEGEAARHRTGASGVDESNGVREPELPFAELRDSISQFKDGIAPLVDSGKLSVLLAQFPYGFVNTQSNLDYVMRLAREFSEFRFVVEFRNSGWVSQAVFDALKANGIGFCCVDEPKLKGLFPPIAVTTSSDVSYVRFHGRNAAKWWQRGDSSERYNYLYSEEELKPWAAKIRQLAENSRRTYVLFNNCTEGKAAENAKQMQTLLDLL